jgi:hypothetical protein
MPLCRAGIFNYNVKKGQVCYGCGQEILRNQPHIYYAGCRTDGKEGHIFLHVECAATLAMRLIHDVISEESETSVENTLRNVRNVFQLQRQEE